MYINVDLEVITRDANDNYDNGRLPDAYQHYRRLVDHYFSKQMIPEAIYYFYRSLLCLNEELITVRDLLSLGSYLVKYSMYSTTQLLERSKDPVVKMKILGIQEQMLSDLSFPEVSSNLQNAMIENLKIKIQEHDISQDEQLEYMVALHELQPDPTLSNEIFALYKAIADQIEEDEISVYQKIDMLQKTVTYCSGADRELIETEISRLSAMI
jgi:hypothetical protein